MLLLPLVFLLKIICILHFERDLLVSSEDIYRLSNTTNPLSYSIELTVDTDCEVDTFTGQVKIIVEAREEENYITLHTSTHITLGTTKVSEEESGNEVLITGNDFNSVTEIRTVTLDSELIVGQQYVLEFSYSAKLSTDKLGLYQSTYENDDGEKVCLLSTQFAPTQARRVFPCFDEPGFKANYDIRIIHPAGTIAISNEPAINTRVARADTLETSFEEVKSMPAYLVGFVIGDLVYNESYEASVRQQVYARENELDHVQFALDFASNVYDYYVKYFQKTLPLKQLKHVAIPDFYFSAMENWGMITYKESRLLFNPEIHPVNLQQSISNVIGHEITHHWFGDLVTMKWWTHVWLKEGFATLFSYYGQHAVNENNDAIQFLLIEKLQYVFTIDSDPDIKPMSKYIEKQADIMANYDKIAYDKACCVLRMMDHAFTSSVFRDALAKYLNQHAYGNTDEDDLFDAIEQSLISSNRNLNVTQIMRSWTQQGGYPLVTVTLENSLIRLKQERFLDRTDEDLPQSALWSIPVTFYVVDGDSIYQHWLYEEEDTLECNKVLKSCSPDKVFIINHQQAGYYRVNYDEAHWNMLAKTLNADGAKIDVNNRAQLIDDAFNLALTGRLNYSIVFNLVKYLKKETEYAPWAAFQRGIATLKRYLSAQKEYNRLETFVQSIVGQSYRNIALANQYVSKFTRKFSRQIIVSMACEFRLEDCLQEQRNYSYPDLREVYYCNRLRASGNNMYSELRNLLKTTTEPILRAEIISSLGCATDSTQLAVLLLIAADKSATYKLTDEEQIQLIQSVYRKSHLGVVETLNLFTNENMKNVITKSSELEKLCLDFAKYINSYDLNIKFLQVVKDLLTTAKLVEARAIVHQNLWWIADYGAMALTSLPNPTNGVSGLSGHIGTVVTSFLVLKYFYH